MKLTAQTTHRLTELHSYLLSTKHLLKSLPSPCIAISGNAKGAIIAVLFGVGYKIQELLELEKKASLENIERLKYLIHTKTGDAEITFHGLNQLKNRSLEQTARSPYTNPNIILHNNTTNHFEIMNYKSQFRLVSLVTAVQAAIASRKDPIGIFDPYVGIVYEFSIEAINMHSPITVTTKSAEKNPPLNPASQRWHMLTAKNNSLHNKTHAPQKRKNRLTKQVRRDTI